MSHFRNDLNKSKNNMYKRRLNKFNEFFFGYGICFNPYSKREKMLRKRMSKIQANRIIRVTFHDFKLAKNNLVVGLNEVSKRFEKEFIKINRPRVKKNLLVVSNGINNRYISCLSVTTKKPKVKYSAIEIEINGVMNYVHKFPIVLDKLYVRPLTRQLEDYKTYHFNKWDEGKIEEYYNKLKKLDPYYWELHDIVSKRIVKNKRHCANIYNISGPRKEKWEESI